MTAITRINQYRKMVTAAIKTALPELASCESQFGKFNLEELNRQMVKAPAVRFAVLSAKITRSADAQASAMLSCAAFAVTEGKDKEEAGWAIAEAITILLNPPSMFGMVKLGAPSAVSIQPVVSLTLNQRGVCIIAVEFSQELHELGVNIFDDEQRLLSELYINDVLTELPADA